MRERLPLSSVVDETCNRFKFTFNYALGEPKVTGLLKLPTGLPAAHRGRPVPVHRPPLGYHPEHGNGRKCH